MKYKWIFIAISCSFLCVLLSLKWIATDKYFIESNFNIEIPDGAYVIEQKEYWPEFGGGYRYVVYAFSKNNSSFSLKNICEKNNYKVNYLKSSFNHPIFDKYLSDEENCVKVTPDSTGTLFVSGVSNNHIIGVILLN